jgi:hypothetical protein
MRGERIASGSFVKSRYRTEAQILKRIESAQAFAQQKLAEAEAQESQAKWCWKQCYEAESKVPPDHQAAANLRYQGEEHRDLSVRAERAAKRILNQVLPRLGEKLSVFRTETLRFQEKEVRSNDHSIPV